MVRQWKSEIVLSHYYFAYRNPWGSFCQLLTNRGEQQSQIRITNARSIDNEFRIEIDNCFHNRSFPGYLPKRDARSIAPIIHAAWM